jgi:hypothetical protein
MTCFRSGGAVRWCWGGVGGEAGFKPVGRKNEERAASRECGGRAGFAFLCVMESTASSF